MTQVNLETVIDAVLKIRDKRAELRKKYMEEDEVLLAKMARLEVYLLEQMKKNNATQLGASNGTAYQQTVMKGNCSDWPTLWDFISQTGRFDFLEKRLSVGKVQEYYEETGELPPGVNINPELKVIVRRK